MIFEREDTIRVINKYGLDTILTLNIKDKENPVTITSACQIDHFDNNTGDKHYMIDQKPIDLEKTLDRLVRTNQHFKVK